MPSEGEGRRIWCRSKCDRIVEEQYNFVGLDMWNEWKMGGWLERGVGRATEGRAGGKEES